MVEAPVVEATTPIETPAVPEVEVALERDAQPQTEVVAVEPAPVVEPQPLVEAAVETPTVEAPVFEEAAPAVREVREVREEQTAFQWTAEPAAVVEAPAPVVEEAPAPVAEVVAAEPAPVVEPST
ncbi:hypothetical protein AO260_06195 [Pseudomonas sp. ABAC21]|nr:hypothetical protein AO260_06195 [Pseudomonas sp. ABAC21]